MTQLAILFAEKMSQEIPIYALYAQNIHYSDDTNIDRVSAGANALIDSELC